MPPRTQIRARVAVKFATQHPTSEKRKPDRVVVLTPEMFAFDWKKRPTAEVALGLRVISEQEVQSGKAEASKHMFKLYGTDGGLPLLDMDKAWECWNDTWLAYAIGRAACDPNDADKQYFPYAQDEASRALTSAGLRRLWDEYCLIHRGIGERPTITDEELLVLVKSLVNIGGLESGIQKEVRKHLAWVAETFSKAGLLTEEEEDGVYLVHVAEAASSAA